MSELRKKAKATAVVKRMEPPPCPCPGCKGESSVYCVTQSLRYLKCKRCRFTFKLLRKTEREFPASLL